MHLGLLVSMLARMRVRGDRPPYSKGWQRMVIYDVRGLDDC
jgi:hypothetical protein